MHRTARGLLSQPRIRAERGDDRDSCGIGGRYGHCSIAGASWTTILGLRPTRKTRRPGQAKCSGQPACGKTARRSRSLRTLQTYLSDSNGWTAPMKSFVSSSPSSTSWDHRRPSWAAVATIATLSVVGSLMTAAPAANAAEESIAVAVRDGSFIPDVVDGHITVDQLVDASIAGRAQGAPALDRATLTRGMTAEVEQLRSTGSVAAWDQMGTDTDLGQPQILRSAAPDAALGTQLSLWHKFKRLFHHWATVRITAPTGGALLGGGTAVGIAAIVAGAFGLLASAIFASIGAVAFITLGSVSLSCNTRHLKYLYIEFPDLGNSHCGN